MMAFRILLVIVALWTNITGLIAIYFHGWNLLAIVASDLTSTTWNAQFDADLLCYLTLSGVWIAWRLKFQPRAILLGILGGFLGNAFLAPYLLFLTYKTNGNVRHLLLGEHR